MEQSEPELNLPDGLVAGAYATWVGARPRPGPRLRYRRVTPFVGTTYVLEWNESRRPEKWEDLEPWPERRADEPSA